MPCNLLMTCFSVFIRNAVQHAACVLLAGYLVNILIQQLDSGCVFEPQVTAAKSLFKIQFCKNKLGLQLQ